MTDDTNDQQKDTQPTPAKGALQALKDGVMDLSELEVLTFKGAIVAEYFVQPDSKKNFNWSKLWEQAATVEGKIDLVAATKIKIDGDTILFFADGISEPLKTAHLEATSAAQAYRQGLVEAFADILNIRK